MLFRSDDMQDMPSYKIGKTVFGSTASITAAYERFDHRMALREMAYTDSLNAEVQRQAAIAIERADKLELMNEEVVNMLAMAIDAKDRYTNGHSLRVASYSEALAKQIGMPEEETTMNGDLSVTSYANIPTLVGQVDVVSEGDLSVPLVTFNESQTNGVDLIKASNILKVTKGQYSADNIVEIANAGLSIVNTGPQEGGGIRITGSPIIDGDLSVTGTITANTVQQSDARLKENVSLYEYSACSQISGIQTS